MDFLTTLYSNDNFGIILFITISILVLAFLIILFFGKKDQKERELAETKALEMNSEVGQKAFQDDEKEVELEVPVPKVSEPVPNFTTSNKILNENLTNENREELEKTPVLEEQKIEPIIPNSSIEGPNIESPRLDFDFDALAASISKELENIGVAVEEPPKDEPIQKEYNEPVIPPISAQKMAEIERYERPVELKEERPKVPPKTQFSSVFVTKKKDNTPVVVELEPVKPLESSISSITKETPKMELPKTIDLPKLNNDSKPELNNHANIVFPSLENDIPAYHKDNENRM
ncbi:MAG: hypothetical protein HFH86_04955 [Bacilli bacterium]|nr:hypothetical protein [Bacilli bacterium]